MLSLFGSGIGRDIAIGTAYILRNSDIETPHFNIEKSAVANEIDRFDHAVLETENKYKRSLKNLPKSAPKESAAFINAHMMMLRDPLLIDESIKIIKSQLINAEQALQIQSNNLIQVFDRMEDTYLRNKGSDVRQITNSVLRCLLGIVSHNLEDASRDDLAGKVIISKDLTPTETMFLDECKAAAFITDLGSPISHTAIVARSVKIPAVMGLHSSIKYITDNDLLIVDGLRGTVLINPTDEVLKEYKTRQRQIRERERNLKTLTTKTSRTMDGRRVQLSANIESVKDLKAVKKVNAAGVGLYRTEYLFMNREQAPSEKEQFQAYKRIVTNLGKPVIIRTLDIGGDKQLDFHYPQKTSSESPLGLRAVRLCLNHIELFKPQLRAILRASAYGKMAVMIPMVSNYDEVNQVLTLIKQTKAELRKEKIPYDTRIKIGGMIEVPAAAIMAEIFAKKLDFLSIGTNDLIQYTLAIDRVDDAVNYLYDPMHPAVLQLIKQVLRAGRHAQIPVSLCGEMAGNVRYTRLLLGLGLKNFSMDANNLLDVKEKVLEADSKKARYLVRKIMNSDNSNEARDYLEKLNKL